MPKPLLLVPTMMERKRLQQQFHQPFLKSVVIETCGFGPVCASAVAVQKIIDHQPDSVILIGIAGGYRDQDQPLEIGEAYSFSTVAIDGIGAGEGTHFQSAAEMGWNQFEGDNGQPIIGERIKIESPSAPNNPLLTTDRTLLTVCSASGSAEQANRRAERFGAVAEDMEGFGVAVACQLQSKPLRIIRGISNWAGDRDHAAWKINEALDAAALLLETILADESA